MNLVKMMKKYKIFFIAAIVVIISVITYIIYNNMETFKVGAQEACASDEFDELCQHTYTFVNTCNSNLVSRVRTSRFLRGETQTRINNLCEHGEQMKSACESYARATDSFSNLQGELHRLLDGVCENDSVPNCFKCKLPVDNCGDDCEECDD
tara:strand:- start:595 stop:1050 length:456 start_codon:yes stop_codon:yes gene_type:complete